MHRDRTCTQRFAEPARHRRELRSLVHSDTIEPGSAHVTASCDVALAPTSTRRGTSIVDSSPIALPRACQNPRLPEVRNPVAPRLFPFVVRSPLLHDAGLRPAQASSSRTPCPPGIDAELPAGRREGG